MQNGGGTVVLSGTIVAARSCSEARCDRAKNLQQTAQPRTSGTGVPHGTARPCHVAASAGCAGFRGPVCYVCSIPWYFRATLFRDFKDASSALFSAKCRSPFRFFDKVFENVERCYMSKMYAKGG